MPQNSLMNIMDAFVGKEEEKDQPAHKPWESCLEGTDISDWFNYGFDEQSFVLFINKQVSEGSMKYLGQKPF